MDPDKMPRKLWEHPDPKSTAMWKFMQDANRRYNLDLKTFQDLYNWSCDRRVDFWSQLWDFQNWIHEGSFTTVVDESVPISQLPRWFEGVRLNWAENFLYSTGRNGERSTAIKKDDKVAATEVREGNSAVRDINWGELRSRTEELARALKVRGVGVGDRVVVVGAHSIQTLVVFLATTWLGAVFSSSSTDMGVAGLLQRTVQIDPKFVFFDDGALYNGKVLDLREKIKGMVEGMKECQLFEKMVVIQRFEKPYDTASIPGTERLEAFLYSVDSSAPSPPFARVGFQDPMMVYYSSGTTGTPKAIVHGVGPLLMNAAKDSIIHREVTPSDVGLQYTTTGWIMYLASVGIMLVGARAVLYDGSPFVPDLKVLCKISEEQGATSLGVSPRWMGELMKNDISPRDVSDLSKMRRVVSTGMVLPDQLFEWFYDVAFPKEVQLANISGGTDIAGCFAMDNPLTPVYVGGCQGGCLGVPVAVYDHDMPEGSKGKPLPHGQAGDLVSTAAFPNVPIYLWNDPPASSSSGPGPKYQNAYFSRFDSVWSQGDFCAIHPKTGAIHLLGRSDGVLNPSGVRFGSADIYAVLERRMPKEVMESLCVGQRRPRDLDERVVLFLIMKKGVKLDAEMVRRVKQVIGEELTKRHVPAYVFEIPEIPVTVNGKKVELPVKHIISGKTVKPSGTLLNPGSLDFFYRFQEIEKLEDPKAKL